MLMTVGEKGWVTTSLNDSPEGVVTKADEWSRSSSIVSQTKGVMIGSGLPGRSIVHPDYNDDWGRSVKGSHQIGWVPLGRQSQS